MLMLVSSLKGYVGSEKMGNGDSSTKQEKKLLLSFMMRLVISVKGYVGSEKVTNGDSSIRQGK